MYRNRFIVYKNLLLMWSYANKKMPQCWAPIEVSIGNHKLCTLNFAGDKEIFTEDRDEGKNCKYFFVIYFIIFFYKREHTIKFFNDKYDLPIHPYCGSLKMKIIQLNQ